VRFPFSRRSQRSPAPAEGWATVAPLHGVTRTEAPLVAVPVLRLPRLAGTESLLPSTAAHRSVSRLAPSPRGLAAGSAAASRDAREPGAPGALTDQVAPAAPAVRELMRTPDDLGPGWLEYPLEPPAHDQPASVDAGPDAGPEAGDQPEDGPATDLSALIAMLDAEVSRGQAMRGDPTPFDEPERPTLLRPTLSQSRRRGVGVGTPLTEPGEGDAPPAQPPPHQPEAAPAAAAGRVEEQKQDPAGDTSQRHSADMPGESAPPSAATVAPAPVAPAPVAPAAVRPGDLTAREPEVKPTVPGTSARIEAPRVSGPTYRGMAPIDAGSAGAPPTGSAPDATTPVGPVPEPGPTPRAVTVPEPGPSRPEAPTAALAATEADPSTAQRNEPLSPEAEVHDAYVEPRDERPVDPGPSGLDLVTPGEGTDRRVAPPEAGDAIGPPLAAVERAAPAPVEPGPVELQPVELESGPVEPDLVEPEPVELESGPVEPELVETRPQLGSAREAGAAPGTRISPPETQAAGSVTGSLRGRPEARVPEPGAQEPSPQELPHQEPPGQGPDLLPSDVGGRGDGEPTLRRRLVDDAGAATDPPPDLPGPQVAEPARAPAERSPGSPAVFRALLPEGLPRPRPRPEPAGPEAVPAATVARFEGLTGIDLGFVPLHRGPAADRAASDLDAQAFTRGGAVHLPAVAGPLDRRDTETLLVHELAHVAQQRAYGTSATEQADEGADWERQAEAVERGFQEGGLTPDEWDAGLASLVGAPALSWTPDDGFVHHAHSPGEVQRKPRFEPEPDAAAPAALGAEAPSGDAGLFGDSATNPLAYPPELLNEPGPGQPGEEGGRPFELTEELLGEIAARLPASERPAGFAGPDFNDPRTLDALAVNLYPHLRGLLRGELIVDRERSGVLTEFHQE